MRDLTGKVGKTYFPVCKRHQKSQNQYQRKSKSIKKPLIAYINDIKQTQRKAKEENPTKKFENSRKISRNSEKLQKNSTKTHENYQK